MKAFHKPVTLSITFLLIAALLAACVPSTTNPSRTPESDLASQTAVPSPTATSLPPTVLNVCTALEPASLYRYDGHNSASKAAILANLYGQPFAQDTTSSTILTALPNQANNGLNFVPVDVQPGDVIVDAFGQLNVFQSGLLVRPTGCYSSDCAVSWESGPFSMDQMQVRFALQTGLVWSDGEALTAQDSLFSFAAAQAASLPQGQWALDRTLAYTAIDEQTLLWQGIPGHTTVDVSLFFWEPLPQHQLDGIPLAELGSDESTARNPLAYGPYRLLAWEAGQAIRLEQNPHYFDAEKKAAGYQQVNFRFVSDREQALNMLASGDCDILDTSYTLEQLSKSELSMLALTHQVFYQPTELREQLVFGIAPAVYDDGYSMWAEDRPNFFGDLRVRQAVAACLNPNELVNSVLDEKFPAEAELGALPAIESDMDPNALLSAVGWKDADDDPNTPLLSSGIVGIFDGTAFEIQLLTGNSALHQSIGSRVVERLQNCGIGVDWQQLPVVQLYQPGPEGPLFGRRFDLALLAWQADGQDACTLYTSSAIPSALNGWVGTNLAGLADDGFDKLCAEQLLSTSAAGSAESWQAVLQALPAIPLVPHVQVWLAAATLGIPLDAGLEQIANFTVPVP